MTLDWREAFSRQAQSDYGIYKLLLNSAEVERCHSLHYLQMATEKLARHFLVPPSGKPKRTHHQFSRFLQHSKNVPALRRACRLPDSKAFAAYIDSLLPTADLIQNLAPDGSMEKVNPEYPWSPITHDGLSRIEVPCQFDFSDFDPKTSHSMKKRMQFIEVVFSYVNQNR